MIDNLPQLHSECFEKRTALTKIIQEFPALQGVAALEEITHAVHIGWNVPHGHRLRASQGDLAAWGP